MTKANDKLSPGLTSQTLRGFSWSSASIVLQAGLQLFVISILSRLLTPQEFGVVGMALIFTNFVERVGFLGLGPAIVQRKELSQQHIRTALSISIYLGLILFIGMYLLAVPISNFFKEPSLIEVLRVLSFVFLLESVSTVPENLLQRELKFKSLLLVTNLSYIIGNGIIGVGMAYLGYGIWALVAASVSTRAVKLVALFVIEPQRPVLKLARKETQELLTKGAGFTLGRLLSFLALNGDNFIIGRLLGASALGMYGRAYQLMTLPATYFGQVLEKVLFPAMAKKQASIDQLRSVYLLGIESSSLVGMSASVFMFVAAREVISFLFGTQWLEVVPTLQILSLGIFFRLCYKNSDTLIRSLGAVYRHASLQAAYAGVVVLGSFIGAHWGLPGVAIAVTFAVAINYMLLSRLGLQLLDISWLRFFNAHLAACWAAAWLFLVLQPLVLLLRAYQCSSFLVLLTSGAVSLLVVMLACRYSPSGFKPQVFEWAVTTFKLAPAQAGQAEKKQKAFKRVMRWILVR